MPVLPYVPYAKCSSNVLNEYKARNIHVPNHFTSEYKLDAHSMGAMQYYLVFLFKIKHTVYSNMLYSCASMPVATATTVPDV